MAKENKIVVNNKKEKPVSVKEFNRVFNNIAELRNRIFNIEYKDVRDTCLSWFVSHLKTLMTDSQYKIHLTGNNVSELIELSTEIRSAKLLEGDMLKELNKYIKELYKMRNNIVML